MISPQRPRKLTLEYIRARSAAQLREVLESDEHIRELLESAEQAGQRWAVVGGAPRYWVLGGAKKPEDLDIVIDVKPRLLKYTIIGWAAGLTEKVTICRNAFGGYRVRTPTGSVDVWAAAATVGIQKGRVGNATRFRAVSRSAALSLDSLVVTCAGEVFEHRFVETVNTGVLHLNHDHIERRERMAEKAVRLCQEFALSPDIAVQAFICETVGAERARAVWAVTHGQSPA